MVFGKPSDSILFVGDIMLARNVENEIRSQKSNSIFRNVRSFQRAHTYAVGNFESAIPQIHDKTEDFTFRFSTASSALPYLRDAGFSHLSLANNHANDYGEEGYQNTVKSIREASLTPFGNPLVEDKTSVVRIEINDTRVSLIGLHAVWRSPDMTQLKELIEKESKSTEIQIVVVHWGDEYEPVHSNAQEVLAHDLIDMGIDAIVGHHPHVIQDIGMYKNAPIFYSLGNYVFDQYWNDEVQTGLVLTLIPHESSITFKIVPVKSKYSVPELMPLKEAENTLSDLSKSSDSSLRGDISRGVITLRH